MNTIGKLKELIQLEKIDDATFVGQSESIGSPIVFGGQVLAQAIYAIGQSVPKDRKIHSLHSYFILPGDLNKEIKYKVEFIRDGGSFSTRYVKAVQEGKVIFFMAASYHKGEQGYEHQAKMPEVPQPEELYSWDEIYESVKNKLPRGIKQYLSVERPVQFKSTVLENILAKENRAPSQNTWFKIKGKIENDSLINPAILAYISDYNLLSTALRPHGEQATMSNTQIATIDHSMWFHEEPDINDWFLYSTDSSKAHGGRGLVKGKIFNQSGTLIASVAQEGLIRKKTLK